MPFYIGQPNVTLQSIFPGVDSAKVFDPATGSWRYIPVNASIRGALADTLRTFSFGLRDADGNMSSPVITWGYPVFEQRYLDMTNNNYLWFGTVNCKVPFSPPDNLPDDWPNGKILASRTWQYRHSDNGLEYPSTDTVRTRHAYRTSPRKLDYSLPYSLDVYCTSGMMFTEDEELQEPIYFPLPDEEIKRTIDLSMTMPSSVDTSDILIRYLEEIKANGEVSQDETENNFGKGLSEQSPSTHDFLLSVFPSPFNNSASIVVTVPDGGVLKVVLYDISGNLVKTIFTGEVSTGTYNFEWDGKIEDLSEAKCGIYFVRANMAGRETITKIVLVK